MIRDKGRKARYLLLSVMVLMVLRAVFVSNTGNDIEFYDLNIYDRILFTAGVISTIVFWLWMFLDFIYRFSGKNRMFWGVFVFFGTYIGATFYFFLVYKKS